MMLIGKCFACKKYRLFVRRRKLMIPESASNSKVEATSRENFCGACFNKVKKRIYENQNNQA